MIKIVSVVLLVITSSCSTDDATSSNNFLHYALRSEPASFDPIKSANLVNAVLQRQIIECLFEYDYATDGSDVVPLLAERYQVSDDGLQWDIYLRQDAEFFDPFTPPLFEKQRRLVTANDVLYCWLRQADVRNNADGFWAMEHVFAGIQDFHEATADADEQMAQAAFDAALRDGIEGIQVVDDHHLRVRLQYSDPWFANRLAMSYFAVYPPEAAQQTQRGMRDQPVGSAVFHLQNFTPGQEVVLARTEDWRDPSLLTAHGINFQVVRDEQTTIELFKRGASDRLTLSHSSAEHFINDAGELKQEFIDAGMSIADYPRSDISMLCFNMRDREIGNIANDALGNQRRRQLRHALALAFPRQQWQDLLYQRLPTITASAFIPPNVGAAHQVYPWHDSLEQAREILKDAGYYDTHTLPSVEFVLFGTNPLSIALGEIYAVALKKIGIECKLVAVPYAQQVQRAVNAEAQIFVRNWSLDWPDSSLIYNTFSSANEGTEINLSHFNNSEFDELLQQLALCRDPQRRQILEAQLDAILYSECPAMPIEHRQSWVLASRRITNFKMRPFDLMPCKFYQLAND
ncbi:MAG: oligopeptide transport system substrate-binding protein [Myxococcota bacterium]|jgi:oligopeptide transport system substrate-binding protein